MEFGRVIRGALLASTLCCAMLHPAGTSLAATFSEFVDPNPTVGNQFGATVVALSTGNVVVTSPFDDAGGTDAGAVYLFNGSTGALISTLLGSINGQAGSGGVTALSNGNYVVRSPANAGAVTWGSGTTGVSGVVSAANSLVGSTVGDLGVVVVTALSNGNYVVASPAWDNGATLNAGAAAWGSGTAGVSGAISGANSLVGSTANEQVGTNVTALSNGNYVVGNGGGMAGAGSATWGSGTAGVSGVVSAANSLVGSTALDGVGTFVTALANGNYVVRSPNWDNGAISNAGAVTWGSGTTGVSGVVSAANSLVGSTANDNVGSGGVTALSTGNYVVSSTVWDNGAISNAGAVTWGSGTTGVSGVISAANSLVGSTAGDGVGSVTALTNGNYVVRSPSLDAGAIVDVGAATWGSGTTGVSGAVGGGNSLVGSTAGDQVGGSGVTALSNGNYVVASQNWDSGATANAGAATWGSGTTGVSGAVSVANSLVGSTANDNVGSPGVTALSNGNYVAASPNWDNGAIVNAGAATWGSGTTGASGVVSAGNSLVGSTANDQVGLNGMTALSNGNYVVHSPNWDNGAVANAGAETWRSGTSAVSGVVSSANSLVGSTASDLVGNGGVTVLSNGNYVVRSPNWDNGAIFNAGAVTWGSGTTGVSGVVSAANSLVASRASDLVGSGGVTALSNGNYVVSSTAWDNGAIIDAGAATWGSGTTGVSGLIYAANSLVGSTANDVVGGSGVTALTSGNYVVVSGSWDNGALINAGAATWGSGTTGLSGAVSAGNSLVGTTANTNLQPIVADDFNNTFFGRFLADLGGRVRVGPVDNAPVIVSAIDIPNDQGGWLRLTFNPSLYDAAGAPAQVATYGVWRHVPGTLPSRAGQANPGAARSVRLDAPGAEWLRAALPAGLDVREVEGRLYATGLGARAPEIAAAFPPGTWELVASISALQQAQYVVAIPTISNAAPNDFVVTAQTTTPSIWFVSAPASGQSVDNLAPAPPTGLTAAYANGQTDLQWAANTEHDLGSYRLYRGTSADFTPSIGNLIATQITTSYADVGPAGSYYKLSAKDVNGNESGFTLITPQQTTGVEGGTPVAFALEGARPNPASGNGLNVVFALSSGAAARLVLFDVSGRRVLEREVGALGAGRHTVNLAAGRGIAPGLYWVRLTQAANELTTRVAVIE